MAACAGAEAEVGANQKTTLVAASCLLLAAAIFALDLRLPLGVAGGVPYIAVVLISLRSPRRRFTLSVAAAVSALTVAGFVWSPAAGVPWMVLSNRTLALFAIWSTALIGLEARRSRSALDAKERQLHRLASRTPVTLYSAEPRGDYAAKFVSEFVTTQTGYKPREFVEDPGFWADRVHPEDRAAVFEWMAGISDQGDYQYDYRFRRKDGTYRWIHDEAILLLDAEGNPLEIVGSWLDVTERKRAEEALRTSEARLNAFFDSAPVGTVLFDDQFRYLKINEAAADPNGLPASDHLGKTLDEVAPEIAPLVTPMFRRILETGEPVLNAEVSGEAPSQPGVTRHWLSSNFRIPGNDPGTWGIGAIVVDITDQRRAEEELRTLNETLEQRVDKRTEALRESERHYRELFDGSPLPLWAEDWSGARGEIEALRQAGVTDFRAHFRQHPDILSQCLSRVDQLAGNKAIVDLFEAESPEQVHEMIAGGFDFEVLVPEETREMFGEVLAGLAEGHTRSRAEGIINTFRGRQRHVIGDFVVMPGYEQSWEYCVFGLTDITERKQAGEALRQSTARIGAILNAAVDAIITIDPSGIIDSFNPAAERIFGYESHEVRGCDVAMLMPSPHAKEHGSYLSNYLRTGQKKIIGTGREVDGLRKDGTTVPLHLSVAEVSLGGKRFFTGYLRDLTEQRHLEQQLRAAAQAILLSEDRERRKLARNLHDDLGQLLALGSMKLGALRDAPEAHEFAPRVREVETLIGAAHERTTSLTFQLSPPVLHDVGIVGATEWLSEELERQYGLHTAIEDDGLPKPLDEASRVFLYRALRELLLNVAKHAGTDKASARFRREEGALSLIVEDAGSGFHSSAGTRGYGLLSIRESLESLGGEMRVESAPGDGTKVFLTVPLASEGVPEVPR